MARVESFAYLMALMGSITTPRRGRSVMLFLLAQSRPRALCAEITTTSPAPYSGRAKKRGFCRLRGGDYARAARICPTTCPQRGFIGAEREKRDARCIAGGLPIC